MKPLAFIVFIYLWHFAYSAPVSRKSEPLSKDAKEILNKERNFVSSQTFHKLEQLAHYLNQDGLLNTVVSREITAINKTSALVESDKPPTNAILHAINWILSKNPEEIKDWLRTIEGVLGGFEKILDEELKLEPKEGMISPDPTKPPFNFENLAKIVYPGTLQMFEDLMKYLNSEGLITSISLKLDRSLLKFTPGLENGKFNQRLWDEILKQNRKDIRRWLTTINNALKVFLEFVE